MGYTANRGGERAIEQSERLYRSRLGPITPDRVSEIEAGLPALVDRVMGEASLYAPDLAALALAQAGGDLYEAVLLLRAWRTTQPRLGVAETVVTEDAFTHRRISAAFKDIPGGQILGPTLDYAHRILATEVLAGAATAPPDVDRATVSAPARQPSLAAWQRQQGLLPDEAPTDPQDPIPDITREPLLFPAGRAHTLQSLARADTGGLLSMGYAAMRGYGSAHPTVNELRLSEAELRVTHPDGTVFSAGRVRTSQAEVVDKGGENQLRLGFSATFGWNEVKVIAAAALDLNSPGAAKGSVTDPEFFLYHSEPVESSGFCIHYKLPHYVTFQSALDAMRGAKRDRAAAAADHAASEEAPAKPAPREAADA